MTVAAEVGGRPLWVQVSEDLAHRDVLIDDIVAEFFTHVGWITVPMLLLLLVIDVLIFRRAMQPIVAASALAEEIGPDHTELRLPQAGMPREVLPLVRAVNDALDRLDAGFRAQREFTADAAHELRTPLAILRTQIDMIEDLEVAEPLRHDVESMSRLVNQLLEISELDTLVLAEDETRRPRADRDRSRGVSRPARLIAAQDHGGDRRAAPGAGARQWRRARPRRAKSGGKCARPHLLPGQPSKLPWRAMASFA